MQMSQMREAVKARWGNDLSSPEISKEYRKWVNNPSTIKFLDMAKEALFVCSLPGATLTPEGAMFAQGFAEGSYAFYTLLKDMAENKVVHQHDDGHGDEAL